MQMVGRYKVIKVVCERQEATVLIVFASEDRKAEEGLR